MSATEASRRFSDLLDAVEAGEIITIHRGNRPVAEVRPIVRRRGRDLNDALRDLAPPDERFAQDIADAIGDLIPDEEDPWAGG